MEKEGRRNNGDVIEEDGGNSQMCLTFDLIKRYFLSLLPRPQACKEDEEEKRRRRRRRRRRRWRRRW